MALGSTAAVFTWIFVCDCENVPWVGVICSELRSERLEDMRPNREHAKHLVPFSLFEQTLEL